MAIAVLVQLVRGVVIAITTNATTAEPIAARMPSLYSAMPPAAVEAGSVIVCMLDSPLGRIVGPRPVIAGAGPQE